MRNRPGRKGFKDVSTDDLLFWYQAGFTMKEVGAKFDISQWTVLERMKKIGFRKLTKHHVISTIFGEFTPASCYWAGFLAADGWMTKTGAFVELSSVDEAHLKKLCRFAGRDEKIWRRIKELNGKLFPMSSISLLSKQIVKNLRENFNIVQAKSLIIQPPLNIPKALIKHFIRGYFDGDGSLGWHKWNDMPRYGTCSGSKDMMEWMCSAIREEVVGAGNPSILKKKEANTYSFEFMGDVALSILDWLYLDSSPETRLDRKYELYLDYDKKTDEMESEKQLNLLTNRRRGQPLDERTQREIIELSNLGLSKIEIRSGLKLSVQTVAKYIKRHEAGLNT